MVQRESLRVNLRVLQVCTAGGCTGLLHTYFWQHYLFVGLSFCQEVGKELRAVELWICLLQDEMFKTDGLCFWLLAPL